MVLDATVHNAAADAALRIYGRVLEEVRADRLVRAALGCQADVLSVQGRPYDLRPYRRRFVCGAGKAACAMASAATEVLPDVDGGLLVTKRGHAEPVPGLEVIEAGHPVPDEDSLRAGEAMLRFGERLGPDDFVLFVLSGGASALVEAPVEGIGLEELRATNEFLLRSGQPIQAINAVRSRLSRVKGGGLARAFSPATVVVLILSDVVGNTLGAIGSGPFVPPSPGTSAAAVLGHAEELPEAVRSRLREAQGIDLTGPIPVDHLIVGSVSLAVHTAIAAGEELGVESFGFADPMQGEAREMGRRIVRLAERHVRARGEEPLCLVFGGEATVTLRQPGKGGRCQEMALATVPLLARLPDCAFLAGGTDGNDGPTDAAGAVVDPDALARAAKAGWSVPKALSRHESYPYLESAGCLIRSGPTGSNVNDLALFVYLR